MRVKILEVRLEPSFSYSLIRYLRGKKPSFPAPPLWWYLVVKYEYEGKTKTARFLDFEIKNSGDLLRRIGEDIAWERGRKQRERRRKQQLRRVMRELKSMEGREFEVEVRPIGVSREEKPAEPSPGDAVERKLARMERRLSALERKIEQLRQSKKRT